jgi:hypothetical protein
MRHVQTSPFLLPPLSAMLWLGNNMTQRRRRAMADQKTVYELIPQLGKLRDEVLFGDVWEQPEL